MAKIIKNVRLTEQQIKTVNAQHGDNFTDKLCSMIDRYDYSELEGKRIALRSEITRLTKQHEKIKTALLKAMEKVDLLILETKGL